MPRFESGTDELLLRGFTAKQIANIAIEISAQCVDDLELHPFGRFFIQGGNGAARQTGLANNVGYLELAFPHQD